MVMQTKNFSYTREVPLEKQRTVKHERNEIEDRPIEVAREPNATS